MRCPTHPENRDFIRFAIKKIIIYHDYVKIILNTGLSVDNSLDTEITVSRDEIYEYGRRAANAC